MAVNYPGADEVIVSRFDETRPHAGKRFACIQAHSDDIPLMCGGLLAKLVAEGYKGWLIQTTNDMMCGPTSSAGETILQNEREVESLGQALNLEMPVINFGCESRIYCGGLHLQLSARKLDELVADCSCDSISAYLSALSLAFALLQIATTS